MKKIKFRRKVGGYKHRKCRLIKKRHKFYQQWFAENMFYPQWGKSTRDLPTAVW